MLEWWNSILGGANESLELTLTQWWFILGGYHMSGTKFKRDDEPQQGTMSHIIFAH